MEALASIHRRLTWLLGHEGAYLDDLLFCPHHPDKGYPGEVDEYKVKCVCRKPTTGMLEESARRYNIDPANSWMVGDTSLDVQTGENAGMRTILLTCGEKEKSRRFSAEPYGIAVSLPEAITLILEGDGDGLHTAH